MEMEITEQKRKYVSFHIHTHNQTVNEEVLAGMIKRTNSQVSVCACKVLKRVKLVVFP